MKFEAGRVLEAQSLRPIWVTKQHTITETKQNDGKFLRNINEDRRNDLVTQIMKTGVVPTTRMKNAMSESSSFCLNIGESVTSRSLQLTGWPASRLDDLKAVRVSVSF